MDAGDDNNKAVSIDFEVVKLARRLRESECKSRRSILRILNNNCSVNITVAELDGWLYYRTRLSQ